MKRSLLLLALSAALSAAPVAFAHGGPGHGGWRHGGGGHGYHGGSGHWVGPVLGAALLGTAVYAATYPRVVYSQPLVVGPTIMAAPPVVVDPSRVAYYCNTYQQYYPTVATCPVPWQVVPY